MRQQEEADSFMTNGPRVRTGCLQTVTRLHQLESQLLQRPKQHQLQEAKGDLPQVSQLQLRLPKMKRKLRQQHARQQQKRTQQKEMTLLLRAKKHT